MSRRSRIQVISSDAAPVVRIVGGVVYRVQQSPSDDEAVCELCAMRPCLCTKEPPTDADREQSRDDRLAQAERRTRG